MVKFPEADARLFKDIFVCKACKQKMRASVISVMAGEVKCRKCKRRALRPVRKK